MDRPSTGLCGCETGDRYALCRGRDLPRFLPLHLAICHGRTTVAKMLLARGAPLSMHYHEIPSSGATEVLHTAAKVGNYDLVRFLLEEYGNSIEWRNRDGKTALHAAVYQGYADAYSVRPSPEVTKLLVQAAAVRENYFTAVTYVREFQCHLTAHDLAARAGNLQAVVVLMGAMVRHSMPLTIVDRRSWIWLLMTVSTPTYMLSGVVSELLRFFSPPSSPAVCRKRSSFMDIRYSVSSFGALRAMNISFRCALRMMRTMVVAAPRVRARGRTAQPCA